MQPTLQEAFNFLLTQNKELLTQLSDLRKTNSEYLDKILELSEKNQRLTAELHDLKLSLLESHATSTPKKPKPRKSTSKKSTTSSPTPPPHVLMQMEKAIALLNQQQGTNTTLDDFDILPIELDDSEK